MSLDPVAIALPQDAWGEVVLLGQGATGPDNTRPCSHPAAVGLGGDVGIAAAILSRKQLQGVSVIFDRVVSGHLVVMLEAQDGGQIHVCPECAISYQT